MCACMCACVHVCVYVFFTHACVMCRPTWMHTCIVMQAKCISLLVCPISRAYIHMNNIIMFEYNIMLYVSLATRLDVT